MSEDELQKSAPESPQSEVETLAETVETEMEVDAAEDLVSLQRQLEEAQQQTQAHWDKLMRSQAEMDNLRKRHERDLENAHKFALEGFSNALLQVRDSLELGRQAAEDETADVAKLREGTELTLKLMADVMDKFGVEQLDPTGQPFNPEFHQAMSMLPGTDAEPNSVVQVIQKGYLLNGRLLRPAMVIVAQG